MPMIPFTSSNDTSRIAAPGVVADELEREVDRRDAAREGIVADRQRRAASAAEEDTQSLDAVEDDAADDRELLAPAREDGLDGRELIVLVNVAAPAAQAAALESEQRIAACPHVPDAGWRGALLVGDARARKTDAEGARGIRLERTRDQ
jgi:hypothetical protein